MRKRDMLQKLAELQAELNRRAFQVNALKVEHEKLLNDYRICYSAFESSQKKVRELSDKLKVAEEEAARLRDTDVKICEENERLRRERSAQPIYAAGGAPATSEADTPAAPAVAFTGGVPGNAAQNVEMSATEQAGANAISDVVLRASELMGRLSASSDPNAHDALTLLLGRTEILKSEILSVVTDAQADNADKAARIDNLRGKAFEYFDSVMGQIDGNCD